MRTQPIVLAVLLATTNAFKIHHKQRFADRVNENQGSFAQGICDGVNGSSMQDCRVSRNHDQNPVCRGRPGEEKERNCLDRPGALAQADPASPLGQCNGYNGNGIENYPCRGPLSLHQAGDDKPSPLGQCNGYNGSGIENYPCRANPLTLSEITNSPLGQCNGYNGNGIPDYPCRGPLSLNQADPASPLGQCNGYNGNGIENYPCRGPLSLHQDSSTGKVVKICDGSNSHDCMEPNDMRNPHTRTNALSLHQDNIKICNGTNTGRCVEPESLERPTLVQASGNYSPITCTDRQQEDCQPTCTESLTRGCTEARTPNWPEHDRFEGKYTHK